MVKCGHMISFAHPDGTGYGMFAQCEEQRGHKDEHRINFRRKNDGGQRTVALTWTNLSTDHTNTAWMDAL